MYYINGKFLLNENIDAMEVKDGKFIWLGNKEEIKEEEDVHDLMGKTVLPAFVESHIHPTILAELVGKLCIMAPEVQSIEEMIVKLQELDKAHPEGRTIQGWGYDETAFKEGRSPTREDLDRVSTEKAVRVRRSDLHNSVSNSLALKLAGIDKDTPDPLGGLIGRDEKGELTGLLSENAAFLVEDIFAIQSEEEMIEKMLEVSKELAKYGIASMTETLGIYEKGNETMTLYQKAMERGFYQDISLYYLWNEEVKSLSQEEIDQRKLGYGPQNGAKVKLKGLKYFLDGTISSGTAGMTKEYPSIEESLYCKKDGGIPSEEEKNRKRTKGFMTGDKEKLREMIFFAKEKGLQVKVHAMGDHSADIIIELAEEFGQWIQGAPSIRIEHGTTLREDQIEKIHELGIGVSGQSIFFYAEYEAYSKYLDEERFLQINRLKSLYRPGELDYPYIALSNDAPSTYHPEPANPWLGIAGTVTRRSLRENADLNENEKLDLKSAIKLYTINAANINDMKDVGALKVGNQGNFMIVDGDLENVDIEKLKDILPEEVYIRGKKI